MHLYFNTDEKVSKKIANKMCNMIRNTIQDIISPVLKIAEYSGDMHINIIKINKYKYVANVYYDILCIYPFKVIEGNTIPLQFIYFKENDLLFHTLRESMEGIESITMHPKEKLDKADIISVIDVFIQNSYVFDTTDGQTYSNAFKNTFTKNSVDSSSDNNYMYSIVNTEFSFENRTNPNNLNWIKMNEEKPLSSGSIYSSISIISQ